MTRTENKRVKNTGGRHFDHKGNTIAETEFDELFIFRHICIDVPKNAPQTFQRKGDVKKYELGGYNSQTGLLGVLVSGTKKLQ